MEKYASGNKEITEWIYLAEEDFNKQDLSQVQIKEGDFIFVLGQHESGWWKGINLTTNEDGWFPADFVRKGYFLMLTFLLCLFVTFFLNFHKYIISNNNKKHLKKNVV